MSITITDGISVVDISEAEVTKARTPRLAVIHPPNRKGDILQNFGSTGFKLSVKGTWVTANNARPDARNQLDTWNKNNTAVQYNDGTLKGWFNIRHFTYHLVPGVPGDTIAINYEIELTESIRITLDDQATIPSGVALSAGQGVTGQSLNYSQQFHTWINYPIPIYWVAPVVSVGGIQRLSLWASSNGMEWFWRSDISMNPTHGTSLVTLPGNSVGVVWNEGNILKYREAGLSSMAVTWNNPVTIASGGSAQTMWYPFLYASSTGRRFISCNSSSDSFAFYDSVDGANWTFEGSIKPSFFNPNSGAQDSALFDPGRYSTMWVAHTQSVAEIDPPAFPIQFVQSQHINPSTSSGTSWIVSGGGFNIQKGDTILVWVLFDNPSNNNSVTVSDSINGTYNGFLSKNSQNSVMQIHLFYNSPAPPIMSAGAAGSIAPKVDIEQSAGPVTAEFIVEQYRNVFMNNGGGGFITGTATGSSGTASFNAGNAPPTDPFLNSLYSIGFGLFQFPMTINETNGQIVRDEVTSSAGERFKEHVSEYGPITSAGQNVPLGFTWDGSTQEWVAAWTELKPFPPTITGAPKQWVKRIFANLPSVGGYHSYGLEGVSEGNYSTASPRLAVISENPAPPVPSSLATLNAFDTQTMEPLQGSVPSQTSYGRAAYITSDGFLNYARISDYWNPSSATSRATTQDQTSILNTGGPGLYVTSSMTSATQDMNIFHLRSGTLLKKIIMSIGGTSSGDKVITTNPFQPQNLSAPDYINQSADSFLTWIEGA